MKLCDGLHPRDFHPHPIPHRYTNGCVLIQLRHASMWKYRSRSSATSVCVFLDRRTARETGRGTRILIAMFFPHHLKDIEFAIANILKKDMINLTSMTWKNCPFAISTALFLDPFLIRCFHFAFV